MVSKEICICHHVLLYSRPASEAEHKDSHQAKQGENCGGDFAFPVHHATAVIRPSFTVKSAVTEVSTAAVIPSVPSLDL